MFEAYAEVGRWSVDVCGCSTDGHAVVTIRTPELYLYFTCPDMALLHAATEFLRSPTGRGSLCLGSFCGSLVVELDWSPREPEVVYLSVTRAEEQSMAYSLRPADRDCLARALSQVAASLAQG